MKKKNRKRNRKSNFTQSSREIKVQKTGLHAELIELYGDKCFLCGDETHRLDMHHIKFKRNGGKYSLTNCVLLCWQCHHVELHRDYESERVYTIMIINKKASLNIQ